MKELKKFLEINYLKSLSYEEINNIMITFSNTIDTFRKEIKYLKENPGKVLIEMLEDGRVSFPPISLKKGDKIIIQKAGK